MFCLTICGHWWYYISPKTFIKVYACEKHLGCKSFDCKFLFGQSFHKFIKEVTGGKVLLPHKKEPKSPTSTSAQKRGLSIPTPRYLPQGLTLNLVKNPCSTSLRLKPSQRRDTSIHWHSGWLYQFLQEFKVSIQTYFQSQNKMRECNCLTGVFLKKKKKSTRSVIASVDLQEACLHISISLQHVLHFVAGDCTSSLWYYHLGSLLHPKCSQKCLSCL